MCLLLLVLLETLLALIAGELTVRGALWQTLRLRSRSRALGGNSVALDHTNILRVWIAAAAHVRWLDLPIDGIFVLAARIGSGTNANLASIVLMMAALRWCVTNHVHVRAAAWVVLLAVVGGELVLVLEEGVLGTL